MAHETRAGILAGKPTLSPPIDSTERGVIVMVDAHSETDHPIDMVRRAKRPSHDAYRVTGTGEYQQTPCFCAARSTHYAGQEVGR